MQSADLLEELDRGVGTAAGLALRFGVSRPTLWRRLAPLLGAGQVVALGAARSTCYGREVGHWPVYRVMPVGEVLEFGVLHALAAGQYYLRELTSDLPYFLRDPRQHWDALGDLIVGAEALDHYLAHQPVLVEPAQRQKHYARLADESMAEGAAASALRGEQPKFTVALARGRLVQHCLVKFSPPRNTPLGRRWSDLLVAEHHAHVCLRAAGLAACESQLLMTESRTYLEVVRFDRVGERGRRGVSSLAAIEAWQPGAPCDWVAAARRLVRERRLGQEDLRRVRLLWAFGALIGNTDRQPDNLAFFDNHEGALTLAPAYDMLPMLFAPQQGSLPDVTFKVPPPTAATIAVWPEALARRYWRELVAHALVSPDFRGISRGCLAALG